MPGELTQAQTLWFIDELRKIKKDILKQDVPDLETFEFFDTETDVPAGAQEFGSDMITQFGDTVVVGQSADDLRYAEVGVYRQVHKVIAIGIAYKWNHMELLAAAAAQSPTKIPRRLRGVTARDIILNDLADIGFNGKPAYGVYGFVNYPGLPRHQMSTSLSESDTAQDIVDDLLDLVVRPIRDTKGVRKPTHLGLGLNKWLDIASRDRHSTKSTDKTILGWFQEQASKLVGREMNIMPSWRFEEADICAVWSRGQKANAKLVIPDNLMFEQLALQIRGFDYQVPCYGVSGGWYTEYPLATCIGKYAA
jgi:hypothetical protein